jgi:hypothetical protein
MKAVEHTDEVAHYQEHNHSSGSSPNHFQPYHLILLRLHHGLWVLLGVHLLKVMTQCIHAMHICKMNVNYSTHQDMQVYLKIVHTCIGTT